MDNKSYNKQFNTNNNLTAFAIVWALIVIGLFDFVLTLRQCFPISMHKVIVSCDHFTILAWLLCPVKFSANPYENTIRKHQHLKKSWKQNIFDTFPAEITYCVNLKSSKSFRIYVVHIDGLVQERRNSIANTPELQLSCTNPSIYRHWQKGTI